MAERDLLVHLDLNLNQLLNALAQVIASDPGAPVEGQFWYNSTTKKFMWRTDTTSIDPVARANHTGTQLASTISNFDTAVRTNRLDQMAVPTADVSMNTFKLTNLAAPVGANDAARLVDVQGVASGLNWKDSVRAATTANGTLASAFANGQVIDGVTLVTGDRILLKNQTSGQENGIYVVQAAGAPVRATDADTAAEVLQFAVFVEEGSTLADTAWVMTTNAPITLNTTPLVIVQFGASAAYLGGNGLVLTGLTFDVGAGTGIISNANDVAIDPAVVVRKFAQDIGDNAATVFVLTHNLNTRDVTVSVKRTTTPWDEIVVTVEATSVNTVTIRFNAAPTTNQYRATIHG